MICDANDVHSNMSAPEFVNQPHARLSTNDTQSLIRSAWPTNPRGGLAQSIAFKDQDNAPSHPGYAGAPTGYPYTRLESAASASPPSGYPAQSPPPALDLYLPFIPSTSDPIQRGLPYQGVEHETATAFASSWPNVLGSAEQSVAPQAGGTAGSSENGEQAESARTLRSVRTQNGDVYAEYEQNTNSSGGRWVCECGSTFVRDSDWERHAVHSLSHGVGGGYDCSICDISFTRYDAMARHRRKKHGGLNDQREGTGVEE